MAPPGVKWTNHIHYTGSCIALTFLFINPATKRDLLVNPIKEVCLKKECNNNYYKYRNFSRSTYFRVFRAGLQMM